MESEILQNEQLPQNESDARNVFESGDHVVGEEESKAALAAFYNGDPDTTVWSSNPELSTRLASFAPKVLTVDGLRPTPIHGEVNKNGIWFGLPARPQKINPDGILAVSADVAYGNLAESYANLGGGTREK